MKYFYDFRVILFFRPIKPFASKRIKILPGALEIREARASDVGSYRCEVLSEGGNETRSARLAVVELPYAPTNVKAVLSHTPPHVANVSWTPGFDGNSAITKFIVQGRQLPMVDDPGHVHIPPSDLAWSTMLTNTSSLARWAVVSNLQAAASYQFRVSAVNAVGEGSPSSSSGPVTLPSEPPSGPPLGLVGSPRSASAIMIQWEPPAASAQNGRIYGYIIRYRLFGYGHSPWSYHNVTHNTQRSFLIEELITFKDYEISISAYNRKGVGVYSESIRVRTHEGVPSASATGVRAQPLNSTAVRVWWTPPDPQKINGVNQGYKVSAWKELPEGNSVQVPFLTMEVPPSPFDPLAEQSAILEGLQKYKIYHITVLCFTNPGDGPLSRAVTVRTEQDVPDSVADLRFANVTDRSVTVLWAPPVNGNGILLGYTLTYMIKDVPRSAIVRNLTIEQLSYTVRDLKVEQALLVVIYV